MARILNQLITNNDWSNSKYWTRNPRALRFDLACSQSVVSRWLSGGSAAQSGVNLWLSGNYNYLPCWRKKGLRFPRILSVWRNETFRKRNSQSLKANEKVRRNRRDSGDGKWSHDSCQERRAVPCSLLSEGVSPSQKVAQEEHQY